jgi:drug/metabolite transporter (DMT)-like permease
MEESQYRGMATAAGIFLTAAILQFVMLLRYVERQPQDRLGIGLFILTTLGFLIAAFMFYRRCQRSEKDGDEQV